MTPTADARQVFSCNGRQAGRLSGRLDVFVPA
jgi:hypothetical protein